MSMPMLAGVGLLVVCSSSSAAAMMMGGEEKEDPVVPKTPVKKKTPEQIKADEAKAALAALKADPDATPAEVATAQTEADNAQAAADASDDSGGSDTSTPVDPYADWSVEEGRDYPGNDIFHYHPNSTIKATKDVCLDKCEDMTNCKLVTFNNENTLCWGKSSTGGRAHGDRNNYFKQEGGDWRVEEGHDYPGNDIFHYHKNSAIKATKDVCLDKCEDMTNCKLVTFNNENTLCWGKSSTGGREHGDRNNYFKP